MEIIKFGANDVENRLAQNPAHVEALPFGAIQLDRSGKILRYNKSEGLISGRTPEQVIGRNFFNEIAPCAKGRALQKAFYEAVSHGQVNRVMDYTFDYKMAPTKVKIHIKSASIDQGIWLFIKRL